MSAVYSLFQQSAQYPPGDTNSIAHDPSDIHLYNAPSEGFWEPWSLVKYATFAESSTTAASNVHEQQQPLCSDCSCDEDASTQWTRPITSKRDCSLPSPPTDPTRIDVATSKLESSRGSPPTQPDKREHNASRPHSSKALRRVSTRKTSKPDTTSTKPKIRGGRAKPASQATKTLSLDPDESIDKHSRTVKERNRIASNKFRVKKREDAKRLRADQQDMERVNRDLSNHVSDLSMQVYDLNMKLLQHIGCDCHLIQEYISYQAHQYIQDLSNGKQAGATTPLGVHNHVVDELPEANFLY
ncbi:uncharacterized protein FMAN_15472 [Fusarium mangiferae]|uniref:BZIP domain-containing protein n=1 Tax=Fusarium mangiferae TaxID=192010 RepID=A0A1L7UF64_FUSMA|nr:uncharacterized protein FMAN_15472 [Fusarium mangiferae]CVL09304.1 uncharacterized protein FMAN_15472 [Fusarium mangiferae]